ncbi:hypothetical protein [Denitrobacterium detoxificans]|nr:hypothetical protein [Denitrobacterium detoxificans]
MGTTPAYADAENQGVNGDNASEVVVDVDQGQQAVADVSAAPIASSEDASMPAAGADIAPSSEEVTAPDAGGDTPASATPAVSQANKGGSADSANLSVADSTPYPGDDGTANVFVGLTPRTTDSYDASTSTLDPTTNAVHVYISSEVGKGVNLEVGVDYLRLGSSVYDARSGVYVTVPLPSEDTSEYTMRSFEQGLMYTWYLNSTPLGQGTYYSDPTTNPALSGGGIAGGSSLTEYGGVTIDDFMDTKSRLWRVDASRFADSTSFRFYRHLPYIYDTFTGTIKLLYPNTGESHFGGSDSYRNLISSAYFETPGERTIVVQFTYVQEYRSKNTVDENVGYVLYASNPVVFHISVAAASAGPANMIIVASDSTTGDFIELNSDDFIVDLQKDYLDMYSEQQQWGGTNYEWFPYAYCSSAANEYSVATTGLYKLTVTHVTNLFEKYVEYFALDSWQVSNSPYIKYINLVPHIPAAQYAVTFYMDDGVTIVPVSGTDENGNYITVDSRLYNEGTEAKVVWKPAHPTKAATEYAKYIFDEWKPVSAADGTPLETSGWSYDYVYTVTCDTNYIAVFRTIPLKNNAGQSIVYATGGLFSRDALPAGVLSYGLTSSPLTASEASNVISAHSDLMSADTVLGMVQVDLTQYNDDSGNTTTNVTEHEGLEGMKLKFNMAESGINAKDGDKLKILQIHKKDESSAEEIIEHKATVENGEVEIELNGKLSTFVFLMDDTATGGEGAEGGTTNPEGGNTSGEGGSGDQGGTTGEGGSGESGSGEGGGASGESGSGETGSGEGGSGESGTSGEGGSGESGSGEGGSGESGSQGEGGSTGGESTEPTDPTGESGEEPSGIPAVDSQTGVDKAYAQTADAATSGASEPAQSNVNSDAKAASAAGNTSVPATSDSVSPLALAFLALAELIAAIVLGICIRRRALS